MVKTEEFVRLDHLKPEMQRHLHFDYLPDKQGTLKRKMAYLQDFLITLRSWWQQPVRYSPLILAVSGPKDVAFLGTTQHVWPYRSRHWLFPVKSGLSGPFSEGGHGGLQHPPGGHRGHSAETSWRLWPCGEVATKDPETKHCSLFQSLPQALQGPCSHESEPYFLLQSSMYFPHESIMTKLCLAWPLGWNTTPD